VDGNRPAHNKKYLRGRLLMKTIVLNEKQGLQVGFNDWEKANCPTITTVGIADGKFSHRIKNSLIKVESVKAVDSLISELQEFRKVVAKYEKEKENAQTKSKKKNTSDVDVAVTTKTLSSLGYSKEEIAKMLNKKEGKKSKKANKK
jgi:hypothetical protein